MIAERHAAVVCQAAAILLQYPDETVRDRIPLVTEAVAALPRGTAHSALTRFLGHIAATSPRDLAETYVATFDRRRRCCLYLTWWTDGETRRRGQALATLKDRYRRHGLELSSTELPDYLPVALEYTATGDLTDGLALLQEHRAGMELLRLALRDAGSPYAAVLEAVCATLPGPSPQGRAAAQRLARTGPPQETVGLEPFVGPAPSEGARR
ncbi:nitrate reductase molybdenum cofactor assembly chaperone [Streptomyces ipomoeae]|uniref:nitrate reductase molybdenum cofactor assembly chaperone n=1 Tax=Streptomyces ipomoeae TaxID=103232 RepID=UPI0029AFBE82|nr:nitrate reductase molybdenum cofactor assembly chaperone [Streptomyces ipomoeae]MDX2820306.1 nitrate reductase molybdenum cofactor assembly chaperone [Streptomyces ipomoeae]MDX2872897.1 nitrate reductase molybdenum cofactor assembly chaperone [Streptomyces ipomoeae]